MKKSNKPGKRKKSEDLDFSKHIAGKRKLRYLWNKIEVAKCFLKFILFY